MGPSSDLSGVDVWVGISGGVDSAVAAALLQDSGARVTGASMRLAEPGAAPAHEKTITEARAVCEALGVPHEVIDVADAFAAVARDSLSARMDGLTTNPCVTCNETVKFGEFREACHVRGAEVFATGHYARIVADAEGRARLARGTDAEKDQSYFLYRLTPETLSACSFPLGEHTKEWAVARAAELDLPVAEHESQDLCMPGSFTATGDPRPGVIVDAGGTVLGSHDDATAFTVGQRKGLGLGADGPYYVLAVEPSSGVVTVGPREEALKTGVRAVDPVWNRAEPETSCVAQVRYRSKPRPAHARLEDPHLFVEFEDAVEAPAPGQSVVCYDSDVVIGGGVLDSTW